MRLWCSAQGGAAWTWAWQPYVGAWIVVLLLAVLYHRMAARPAEPAAPRRGWLYAAGLVVLWATLDWPLAALGAGYLASAHMVQYLTMTLVVPPLLLLGLPAGAWGALERRPALRALVARATRPVVALVAYTAILGFTHLPAVLDTMMRTQVGSFAFDALWFLGGVVFWWPLLAPVPDRSRFHPLARMGYLFAATIPSTAVGLMLVLADYPQYATYELAPRVAGIGLTALEDQRLAGLLMKFAGGAIVWTVIAVIFFRWALREDAEAFGRRPPRRTTVAKG